jgi:lipooligosaccharide transport system ATP-binding protein
VVDAGAQLPLVHARGLVKRFGELVAVDGVDFDVERGEAFGFLGPNGAGKTSTMRMIGCVSPPSGGTLRILGLVLGCCGLFLAQRRIAKLLLR